MSRSSYKNKLFAQKCLQHTAAAESIWSNIVFNYFSNLLTKIILNTLSGFSNIDVHMYFIRRKLCVAAMVYNKRPVYVFSKFCKFC